MTPLQIDVLSMQIRLFRQFMERHHISKAKASQLFVDYDIFGFIADCYDALHISSDICALNDIDTFLKNREVAFE